MESIELNVLNHWQKQCLNERIMKLREELNSEQKQILKESFKDGWNELLSLLVLHNKIKISYKEPIK